MEVKYSDEQVKFMKGIGIDVDFDNLTDDDIVEIETRVGDKYVMDGLDEDYNPTEEGMMCESILDMMND